MLYSRQCAARDDLGSGDSALIHGDVCGHDPAAVATVALDAHAAGRDIGAALTRFHGEFGVLVVDRRDQRATLIASRSGVAPMYLHLAADGRALFVADDLRVLVDALARHGVPIELDRTFIGCYLAGLPDDPLTGTPHRTPFRGIRRVPAGCTMTVGTTMGPVIRYWRYWEQPLLRRKDVVEAVFRAFLRAVEVRCVPGGTGVMLSGGLDSGSVAGAASRYSDPLHCYTKYMTTEPVLDERRYATAVSSAIGARQHFLTADGFWALRDVPDRSRPPLAEPHQGWFYRLSTEIADAAAGDGVSVLLDGNGGDELFGGDFTRGAKIAPWKLGARVPLYPSLRTLSALSRAFPHMLGRPLEVDPELAPPFLERDFVREIDLPGRAERLLAGLNRLDLDPMTKGRLYGYAYDNGLVNDCVWGQREVFGPRGLQWRHPFYDHALVETMFAVPMDLQLSRSVTKPLLRRAMRPLLPPLIATRRFNADFDPLVRGGLRAERERLVALGEAALLVKLGVVTADAFRDTLVRHLDRDDTDSEAAQNHSWNLITLEMWLRDHVERAHLRI